MSLTHCRQLCAERKASSISPRLSLQKKKGDVVGNEAEHTQERVGIWSMGFAGHPLGLLGQWSEVFPKFYQDELET